MKSILIFLFLFPILLIAQESTVTSLVYLKDGGFLKGEILEKTGNQVKIKLWSGTIVELSGDEVKRIKTLKKQQTIFPGGQSASTNGFYFMVGTNILVAEQASEISTELRWGAGLDYTAGYRINRFLGVGMGLGMDFYARDFAPVYLHLKGELFNKIVSPTYTLNAGYSFPLSEWFDDEEFLDKNGGWMFNPSLGVRIATTGAANLQLDIGYKFQYYTEKADWGWASQNDKVLLKSLAFKMALIF